MSEIIGLPVLVSERHRIVINRSFRDLLNIPENGSVQVIINRNRLQVFPNSVELQCAVRKDISAGRFNLPMEWVRNNGVEIGDYVFLIAAEDCLLVCPSAKNKLNPDLEE